MQEMAKDYHEYSFDKGRGFLIGSKRFVTKKSKFHSSFLVTQATESLYSVILFVFSNYKPKLHNLRKLGSIAENYDNELRTVSSQLTEEQKKCFEFLEKAYVDAKYNKNDERITALS